jgi:hypothetical protein
MSTSFQSASTESDRNKHEEKLRNELIRRRPPANIAGLNSFIQELSANGHFTDQEQERMKHSVAGALIAKAIVTCEASKRRSIESIKALARELPEEQVEAFVKSQSVAAIANYNDCLAKVACLKSHAKYSDCWNQNAIQLSDESLKEIKELSIGQRNVLLDGICRKQRKCVARCVGKLVSATVAAAADANEFRELTMDE